MSIYKSVNRPIATSIGMFDLLKGIAMVWIVFWHNIPNFSELYITKISHYSDEGALVYVPYFYEASMIIRLCFTILVLLLVSLMPTLFILSGYSIRKRTISKGCSSQYKELLKPYLITVFVTVSLNIVFHYCFFRYLPGAVQESVKVFGGMILGYSQNVQIGEFTFFANGPMWFVLSLFWALVIFNVLLNKVDETKIKYYAFGLSILGWLLSYTVYTPFCISQGLVGVLYVYLGYYVRKSKILASVHSKETIIKYILWVIIPNIILISLGLITEMADNVYSLGPISYIESGLMGIGFIYVYMRMNQSFDGKVSNALRYFGRYSLYFLIIHTVEMIAIPWYVITDKFTGHQLIGCFIVFVIRMIIITLALAGVIKILTAYRKLKSR